MTGRNGAGKSSLLAMLAGRLRPDAGAIRVEGVGETSRSRKPAISSATATRSRGR